jgi:hypothetical protein
VLQNFCCSKTQQHIVHIASTGSEQIQIHLYKSLDILRLKDIHQCDARFDFESPNWGRVKDDKKDERSPPGPPRCFAGSATGEANPEEEKRVKESASAEKDRILGISKGTNLMAPSYQVAAQRRRIYLSI